jgi:hypothetical protein
MLSPREKVPMKDPLSLHVLAVMVILAVCAVADTSEAPGSGGEVLFLGQIYCQQMQYCPSFSYWGNSPPGYVELTKTDGTPSDYLWVDFKGQMTFESNPLNVPPPAGLPLLGKLVDNGSFQEVDQFFPAGSNRPLFLEDSSSQLVPGSSTPEPSTLWLLGSGGLILFGWRLFR